MNSLLHLKWRSSRSKWFEETNVARKIRDFLESDDYEITKFNDDKRQKGPDIISIKEGQKIIIEVKDYPSDKYVRGPDKGKKKKTPPNLQAKQWLGEALPNWERASRLRISFLIQFLSDLNDCGFEPRCLV